MYTGRGPGQHERQDVTIGPKFHGSQQCRNERNTKHCRSFGSPDHFRTVEFRAPQSASDLSFFPPRRYSFKRLLDKNPQLSLFRYEIRTKDTSYVAWELLDQVAQNDKAVGPTLRQSLPLSVSENFISTALTYICQPMNSGISSTFMYDINYESRGARGWETRIRWSDSGQKRALRDWLCHDT